VEAARKISRRQAPARRPGWVARLVRRFVLRSRLRAAASEIARLEELRLRLAPALDRALRERDAARLELLFLDINRPAARVAMGEGARDGVVRRVEA
jgi:hypothetical protein